MSLLALLVAAYAAAIVTALWAGLGVCRGCSRMCPPWTDLFWRHTPHP